ncbi:homeobox protein unc-4 homolog [Lineus longissimus]|uniref:homeobox protein unc-4 homolog n=1 Tax=Lineus longissimus TaxID=88925 RepID=UPI00315C9167
MLNVQQAFPGAQDMPEQEHDPYTYENEDSGRLTSAPSPEPYGMIVSDPTPTHVAHWGTHQAQPFTGYVQDYTIVPQYEPPPKKQRVERRRERLNYTRYQLEVLHYVYKFIRYPNNMQKQLIGKRVGISRHQAKIWFQNRRRKDVMNIPPADLPDDKSMVPDAVKKGVLSELLKHKDETPVKTTFKSEKRKSMDPRSVGMSPQHIDNVGRSSPLGARRMGTASPDVLLNSDSNASYSSQPRSAGQHLMSEDVYSDANSNPGSPYSPQMTSGPPSRHSTDQGVYSDSPSNPGSPFSQFSVSPTSAFKPRQKVNQNRLNSPDENRAYQHPTSNETHREMFFHYNDGSYHFPGGRQAPSIPVISYPSHPHTNEMSPYVPQQAISPSDQEKSPSPKSQPMPNVASPQEFGHFPGYQELMNYKQAHEVPNTHNPSPLEDHSDDLVSHRSHSNSETGSDHGEHSDTSRLIPIAHQAPAFNVNRVFPFPFYAEPPMALSSMPNHHYQYHPAWAYQAQAIQTAHNPFYGHGRDLPVEQPHPDRIHSGPDPASSPPATLKDL